jgi:gamma-glutamylcysteine synthetase
MTVPAGFGAKADAALETLATEFRSRFPERVTTPRTVGREAEFTVVTADGSAADCARLWPHLLDLPGARALLDQPAPDGTRLPIGAETDRWFGVAEVGRGTVEVGVGPRTSLHELGDDLAEALGPLLGAAHRYGWLVLGYGIQPRTPATRSLMTPKRRYLTFLDIVGPSWLRFGLTASDQLQCALGRDELVPAMNAINAMSGALVALSANSSVYGGRAGTFASGREGLMRGMVREEHRHGSVPRAFADELDYVRWAAGFRCLVLPDGRDGFRLPGMTYAELAAREGPSFEDFSYHEHYLWPSARPRSRLGTLEVRPACQQPSAAVSIGALTLGIVEAREEVLELAAEIGWDELLAYRRRAVRKGMGAEEPVPGFLVTLLDLAARGLRSRGLDEERYLAELGGRAERRRGPADEARDAFHEGGIRALVEATAIDGPSRV